MQLHSIRRCILCLLWIGLWLLTGSSVASGARVAGEEGVKPAASGAAQPAAAPLPGKPAAEKPHAQAPAPEEPVQVQQTAPPRKQGPEQQQAPANQASDTRYVTIDFDNVDIALFIKFISELTGKNFVIDKAVRGMVTIISPTKISVDEAYKVFESVLDVHGFAAVPAGSVIKIMPAGQARSKNIETRLRQEAIDPEDRVVTQLVPLEYADPDELKKLFSPLISKSSVIISYPPTGMLIVTDVLSNIKRLLCIVKAIDVVGIGEEISVIPLENATASVLVKSLVSVFQGKARKKSVPVRPQVKIIADERTNSLVIAASKDETRRVKELIDLLDKDPPRGEGDIHVYYLSNANADDLTKVLMALPAKQAKTVKKGKTPVISKEVQIVADKATNSLVITAGKDDYLVLEDVIKKLDIPRAMVYIECLIMEVRVTKDFELGVEWRAANDIGSYDGREFAVFGGYGSKESIFPTPTETGIALPAGLALGVLGEGITIGGITFPTIGAVVRAYKSDSDVHIISTPQILTTDNEEAGIEVGENVPYVTRMETTETYRDYSNYEYKDVGVTLKITPQINQERFVRLKVFQEVIKMTEDAAKSNYRPTTLKRLAETTVIVKDGDTVVIGGLIGDDMTRTKYEVPCLGNIPLLGWLFRSSSRSGTKTNLFVFLTPHIIENPAEAKKIYEEKKEQIDKVEEGVIKMYETPEYRGREIEIQ